MCLYSTDTQQGQDKPNTVLLSAVLIPVGLVALLAVTLSVVLVGVVVFKLKKINSNTEVDIATDYESPIKASGCVDIEVTMQ